MSSKCCAYFVLCLLLVVLPASYANKNSKIEDNHANTLQFFNKLQHNIHTKTFFPAASSSQATTTVSVQTPLGEVVGLEENGYRVFKGIPFAQPPINENRWAAPQPITQWNKTLQATQYPSACPQTLKNVSITPFITTQLSEDCLYLNIWTPKQSALPNNKKVPVMVWFHGGAFVTGWGGDGLFWGDYIVNSTSDTIVVTTNYRLGALASFNSPELTGNYGFLDQQMALQWVQEYISYFGGDSSQVTIFGQSAGAMSVTLHTLSPSSNGLFSRAIAESNPAGVNYRTPEENAVYSEKLGELVGCNYTDTACLRSKTWEEIVSVQTRVYEMTRLPLTTFEFLPYAPVIDGTIIPLQPMAAFRSGKVNSGIEAMVFGVCRNETLAFIPVDIPLREVVYKSIVQAVFGDNSTKVLSEYPGTRGSNLNQLSVLTTDWLFLCASRFAATAFANSNIETFMYNFMHPPSNDPINASSPACDGAVCHSAELSFVRNSIDFVIPGSFTPAERKLSFGFVNYWINFAHGVVESNAFGPAWPAYNASTDVSLDFDIPTITTLQNYHADKCAFWDSFGYYN